MQQSERPRPAEAGGNGNPGNPPMAIESLFRLMSAPMAGVSTPAFRRICREKGATMTFTEMVSARGLTARNRITAGLLSRHDDEGPVAAQIFGSDPGVMAQAARIVEGKGFRLVDINMGCPVRKVVQSGAGAALMREPGLAADIVAAVRQSVSIPVSAKIRSGWDSGTINAAPLAVRLEAAGLSALTVHGRTRDAGYGGKADRGVIADVAAAVAIPVAGNGDVVDGDSALSLLKETRCHGVMVGRAALGNPWVFSRIMACLDKTGAFEEPTLLERYLVFLRHARGTIRESGRRRAALKLRTIAVWYTKGFKGASEARRRIQKSRSLREIREIIKALYGLVRKT